MVMSDLTTEKYDRLREHSKREYNCWGETREASPRRLQLNKDLDEICGYFSLLQKLSKGAVGGENKQTNK